MNPQVLATLIDALEAEGNESSIVANDAGRAWELLNAAREILRGPAPYVMVITEGGMTRTANERPGVGETEIDQIDYDVEGCTDDEICKCRIKDVNADHIHY